ncbi:MAG TPA: ornithine carbamoyltransferase [Methanomassiliicoccales archaeon]|jgi:ornithine carbamoyltransferase
MVVKKRDVISMMDLKDDLEDVLELAAQLKKGKYRNAEPLKNMTMAMIFEKASTRTRVSFEAGMTQLGGHAIFLNPKDMQLGRGETVADTAKVLSRYVDVIMYRAFKHEIMMELAEHSRVPVVNALDDLEHPCQITADLQTVMERKGKLDGLKITYVGDGNNVCNSLMLGAAMTGMDFAAACPKGYQPNQELTRKAKEIAGEKGRTVSVVEDPKVAVKDADVLYTDVWVSMGEEDEAAQRERVFKPYQINADLVSLTKDDSIVMHCMPAHRGMEITAEVFDGERSVVFDEAENRLHAQKAIILTLIGQPS